MPKYVSEHFVCPDLTPVSWLCMQYRLCSIVKLHVSTVEHTEMKNHLSCPNPKGHLNYLVLCQEYSEFKWCSKVLLNLWLRQLSFLFTHHYYQINKAVDTGMLTNPPAWKNSRFNKKIFCGQACVRSMLIDYWVTWYCFKCRATALAEMGRWLCLMSR
jgi:hypothetical protein